MHYWIGLTLAALLLLLPRPVPVLAGDSTTAIRSIRVYSVAEGRLISSARVNMSPAEWRRQLTPFQYHVLREAGTEAPFENRYYEHKQAGIYRCAGCGLDLFSSSDKYDSKTGWPSFTAPVAGENVHRTNGDRQADLPSEVVCARCEGHLGHVFADGPPPAGLRYCINSAALVFVADETAQGKP
jgi:peptide-methionine (R)-S-oxide reductase